MYGKYPLLLRGVINLYTIPVEVAAASTAQLKLESCEAELILEFLSCNGCLRYSMKTFKCSKCKKCKCTAPSTAWKLTGLSCPVLKNEVPSRRLKTEGKALIKKKKNYINIIINVWEDWGIVKKLCSNHYHQCH